MLAWALFLTGSLAAGATLIVVSTLGAARWFAWTTASLVSQLPSARVWTRRTVDATAVANYSAPVPGVDISAGHRAGAGGRAPHALRHLELRGSPRSTKDGTLGVRGVDLTVERGQLVLVLGPVGLRRSPSLLRALAGIVHHTGGLRWNGETVTEPEMFLRPNQVRLRRSAAPRAVRHHRRQHPARTRGRRVGAVSTAQRWSMTWRPPAVASGC